MKLNPFSKKSNPYLDKIKSEHDALNLELAPSRPNWRRRKPSTLRHARSKTGCVMPLALCR